VAPLVPPKPTTHLLSSKASSTAPCHDYENYFYI
jgi:hypothetical protein